MAQQSPTITCKNDVSQQFLGFTSNLEPILKRFSKRKKKYSEGQKIILWCYANQPYVRMYYSLSYVTYLLDHANDLLQWFLRSFET